MVDGLSISVLRLRLQPGMAVEAGAGCDEAYPADT